MFIIAFRRRLLSLLFLSGVLLFAGSTTAVAQTRYNTDSATKARQQALEITRAAQKRSLDSARIARQHSLDSLKAVRQVRAESMQAVRKYRESRHFRDSVAEARKDRVETIREAQRTKMEALKDARQRVTDSIVASREASMAVIHKTQKHRTDSLAAIKKYKTSRRFADSVAIVQKARTQSLQATRKAFSDSLTSVRTANMAKLKAARKVTTDSLAAIRKVRTDSLTVRRKAREAALAKNKDNQNRDKKVKEKNAENKAALAFELKIKKKRSVYTNESMLKKKWSAPRKAVQNTFTHYNYYFNAERKMAEAEANMQRSAHDKWDERIALYSFNPATDSTQFAADMDSVIQKSSLGILIHDPRTKWADDLYLLLGKAYFYKGDMDNATSSFKYIVALHEKAKADAAKKAANSNKTVRGGRSKEAPSFVTPEEKGLAAILKREPANNEGLLWLARTYTTYGRYGNAESILDILNADPKFPESLRGELALQKGFLELREHNDKLAASDLVIASADKNIDAYTRRRAAYLAGEILQSQGSYNEAARQYVLVTDLHPKIEMDFYARRNRAYALMQSGGVQKDAIASLKSMLGDGKFSPYYEQIYYVLGRLSANAGNNTEAVAYLHEGLSSAKTTRKQKALSFAAMGNIYFATGAYQEAKIAYDSVSRFATAAQDDSAVAIAMRRAPLVDKIALPAYIIHSQDSLLALGAGTDREQRAVVRRYIKAMQARKADSAFQAENGGIAAAGITNSADAVGGDASATSWYFTNPAMMQQGITDFKRKWGNRPQTDNWRRSAAIAASGSGSSPGGNTNSPDDFAAANIAANSALDENGLPTEEALLAFIPTTPEARAVSVGRLQRSYVDMASAYLRQFEDYPRATAALDTFDKRWILNPYTAEATYLRYLIALRRNDLKEAQRYSDKLQRDFPSTQWASYVAPAPGADQSSGPALASVGEYYDATYDLLQQRQYGEVLSRTRAARRQYTDEAYGNRFRIVEAMAYAGTAQYGEADTILTEFIRNHNGDPLKPWAEQVLSYVSARRGVDTLKPPPVNQSAANTGGLKPPDNIMLALAAKLPGAAPFNPPAPLNTPAPSGTRPVDTSSAPVPADYVYKPADPHYFIFSFSKMEPKAMGVKAGISDLNTFRFGTANLDASVVPMKSSKGIIVVKTFKNASAARTYLSSFNDAKTLVREYQGNEYQTFVISAANYRKLVSDGSISSYLPFYRAHY